MTVTYQTIINEINQIPVLFLQDVYNLLPNQCLLINDLLKVCFFDSLTYCKSTKFIETKVPAMKLQGFNHLI
ncbi:MAG: hypothetical protein BWY22_00998 [Bacteroidetes bacterium ADurb.Bin217]|jgi:hypothetical protein|nr:MAG: hypothetical protein BWY22_00998 [Bacteroidetes bacterium ADurb.Bin217]